MFEFLPALTATLSFGSVGVITKKLVDEVGTYKSIVYSYLILSFMLILGAVLLGIKIIFPFELAFAYVAQVIIGAISIVMLFKALEHGKASVLLPLSRAYVLLVMVAGAVFFSELLTPVQTAGVLLIVVASAVMAFENLGQLKLEKGVIYIVGTILGWAYYFTFLRLFVEASGAYAASLFLETGITGVIASYYLIKKEDLSVPSKKETITIGIRSGLHFIATLAYNLSVAILGAVLTAAVVAATPLVEVTGAYLLLKEKLTWHKYAAVLLMIIGLIITIVA